MARLISAFAALLVLTSSMPTSAENRFDSTRIQFHGHASGGNLVFCDSINPAPRMAQIETQKGESAESVVTRLVAAINDKWRDPGVEIDWAVAENNSIKHPGSCYFLAGTESGLGIPLPPIGLTGFYDTQSDAVTICWINQDAYDEIVVNINSYNAILPGDQTSYTLTKVAQLSRRNDQIASKSYATVFGRKNKTPSSAGAVAITQCTTREALDYPFAHGISPNWTYTSTNARASSNDPAKPRTTERTIRKPRTAYVLEKPEEKIRYQLIPGDPASRTTLVRPIVGLQPGGSYRVSLKIASAVYGVKSEDSANVTLRLDEFSASAPLLVASQLAGISSRPIEAGRSKKIWDYKSAKAVAAPAPQLAPEGWKTISAEFTLSQSANAILLSVIAEGSLGSPDSSTSIDWLEITKIQCAE